jgi:predicted nucleic acid-binding protein
VIFADTSFLVSLYVDERRSPIAHEYTEKADSSFAYTRFHRLELRTALRLRVFRKEITEFELKDAFRLIEKDLQEGTLHHQSFNWNDVLRQAEEIGGSYLIEVGARSGDLLHVASAVVLAASEFCTFDRRQAELARRSGLKVVNFR